MRLSPLTLVGLLCGWAVTVEAAVLDVGTGRTYPTLASLPALAAGDEVRIHPGTYREAKRWIHAGTAVAPIVVRGVGDPRPVIDAAGVDLDGTLPHPRAVFQIEASHVVIEHLTLRGARNDTDNGAGVRVTGGAVTTTDVVVRDCAITACDNGVVSDGCDRVLIEGCEIVGNGAGDGVTHNVYMLGGGVTLRACWIHHPVGGQNVKSRCHFTALLYNRIEASDEGEIGFVDSAATAGADSNGVMIGNTVISVARGPGRNSVKFIEFGPDVGGTRQGTLYAFNNTFVAGTGSIRFLHGISSSVALVASGNLFVGSDHLVDGSWNAVAGSGNWAPTLAAVPTGFTATTLGADPRFLDRTAGDLRLAADSPCIDVAATSASYRTGSGAMQDGLPDSQYQAPMRAIARAAVGAPDAGAYERGAGGNGGVAPPGTSVGGGAGGAMSSASAGGGGGGSCGAGGVGAVAVVGAALLLSRRRPG